MAISILQQPDFLEPAYQDYIAWLVNSTLINNTNFKFNFDVYTGRTPTTVTNFKTRIRTSPRTNGQCVYSPTYVLQSDLTFNLSTEAGLFGNSNPLEAEESEIFYYIQFLEQWNPNLNFVDVFNTGGFVTYDFGTFSHPFLSGDVVNIIMNNQLLNPQYNGNQTITSVPSPNEIITNIPFGTPFLIPQSGFINDVVRSGPSSSIYRALNGARQYEDRNVDWANEYEMDNTKTDKKFLSVWPVQYTKPIFYSDNEYMFSEVLSYVLDPTATVGDAYWVIEYFDNTNTLQAVDAGTTLIGPTPFPYRYDVNVGPNFAYTTGALPNPLITNTRASIVDITTGLTMSEYRTYKYVKQCKDYELIQLAFKNKLGGFDFWVFNRLSKYSSNISRKEIRKPFRWNWDIGDRGRSIVHQDITETWVVNTDWLEDHEALFIRELIESPEVYMMKYDWSPTTWLNPPPPEKIPIIITSNKYDYKSSKNDMIFQYEIEFQKAYEVTSNI